MRASKKPKKQKIKRRGVRDSKAVRLTKAIVGAHAFDDFARRYGSERAEAQAKALSKRIKTQAERRRIRLGAKRGAGWRLTKKERVEVEHYDQRRRRQSPMKVKRTIEYRVVQGRKNLYIKSLIIERAGVVRKKYLKRANLKQFLRAEAMKRFNTQVKRVADIFGYSYQEGRKVVAEQRKAGKAAWKKFKASAYYKNLSVKQKRGYNAAKFERGMIYGFMRELGLNSPDSDQAKKKTKESAVERAAKAAARKVEREKLAAARIESAAAWARFKASAYYKSLKGKERKKWTKKTFQKLWVGGT